MEDVMAGLFVLVFLPLVVLVVLANFGERHQIARYLTYGALLALNSLLGLMGLLLIVAGIVGPQLWAEVAPEMGLVDWGAIGLVLVAAAGVASLVLLPPVRRLVARLGLNLDPGSCVHAAALSLAVVLVGTSLMNLWLIPLVIQQPMAIGITPQDVWVQELGFALLGVAGVGLFVRRGLRETLERLKLRRLSLGDVGLGAGMVAALLAFTWVVSVAWSQLWPESYQEVERITDILFGNLQSPLGAVTLGLAAGLGEEVLFRGALQPRFGLPLTTLLFAAAHTQYTVSPALVEIFVVGLILGLVRDRRSTTLAILVHAGYNIMQVVLAPWFP
jgi:hypothetical protein